MINKAFFAIVFFLSIHHVYSQQNSRNIEIIQKTGEQIPEGITFIDENYDTLDLKESMTMPTVISFVYYECPGLCPSLMNEIGSVIDKSDMELGKDYQVFTISFNPLDVPPLALKKKNTYLNHMDKVEQARKWWKFLTADEENIAKLTDAVGYRYKKAGQDYIHKAAMLVLNSDGMISRYLIGTEFLPSELKISVMEAKKGNTLPASIKSTQYCLKDDHVVANDRVHEMAWVVGIITIIIAVILFLILWLRPEWIKKSRQVTQKE